MKWKYKILSGIFTICFVLASFPNFTFGSTVITSSSEIIEAQNLLVK